MSELLTELWKEYVIKSTEGEKWREVVFEKYKDEKRGYHNLKHLENMFGNMMIHMKYLKNPGIVAKAIFFHDVIYNPEADDNELQSARLFLDFVDECKCPDHKDDVVEMIMATQNHFASLSKYRSNSNDDLLFFLDFDLAILGSSREDYLLYSKGVRKEYSHFNDLDFAKGRSSFLSKMLVMLENGDEIYSKLLDLNEVAKKNIIMEIDMLKNTCKTK